MGRKPKSDDPDVVRVKVMIGQQVRAYRLERGMTQWDVAKAANLQPSGISQIETGAVMASVETLTDIARALGVNAWDLFPRPDVEGSSLPAVAGVSNERIMQILNNLRKDTPGIHDSTGKQQVVGRTEGTLVGHLS